MSPAPNATANAAWNRFLVRHRAGEMIFREGDVGDEMFIVHTGEVEIAVEEDGSLQRLARLEKGDFFGEMSLLEDLPRNASARALSDVQLVRVDRATFDKMLRANPEIAVRIMRRLSGRLRQADRMLRRKTEKLRRERASGEPVPGYRLRHRGSERLFPLAAAEIMVGRRDPVTGIHPEIDLSEIDPERSSSRRHAKLVHRDGGLYLIEDIGTTNGTFVDGERLRAGVARRVSPGATLRFGLVEFELLAP
ncbi:MAG: cyclic nucleotide-binding domain-containing protein [Thermoanaerobaculia bacterium]|nr:cyclic nucleotide-binding domain-containing protein [Thermoanaerobaculia bacterium]